MNMFCCGLQEANFKEFLNRPENRPHAEAAQREELQRSIRMSEKLQQTELKQKVAEQEGAIQEVLVPLLRVPMLRRVLQCLANDQQAGFEHWASNATVLSMLTEAKRLLDEGRLTEQQLEWCIMQQLKDPSSSLHAEFQAASSLKARLGTEQLVEALNEHLVERRKGSEAYRGGRYEEALETYRRAAAVLDVLQPANPHDQQHIDTNKITVHLNLAAAHLALEAYAAAAAECSLVLELDTGNVTALLRRARANMLRFELEAAERDLAEAEEQLAPGDPNVEQLRVELVAQRWEAKRADARLYGAMLRHAQ